MTATLGNHFLPSEWRFEPHCGIVPLVYLLVLILVVFLAAVYPRIFLLLLIILFLQRLVRRS